MPPSNLPWDADGWPPYLLLDLLQWKNRPMSKGAYQIKLVRNRTDPRFCPVFWLLYWLSISDLKAGPIIVRIEKGVKKKHIPVAKYCKRMSDLVLKWFTDAECKHSVEMTIRMMGNVVKGAFTAAGYPTATLYTIRKTATMWGARCNGEVYALLATGRWREASKHFYTYVKTGKSNADVYEDQACDPIRQIWAYHANVMTVLAERKDSAPTHPVQITKHTNTTLHSLHKKIEEDDEVDTTQLPLQNVPKGMRNQSVAVEEMTVDVHDLVTRFKESYVNPYATPQLALENWLLRMKRLGVHVPIDRVGLGSNTGPSLTVRPPLEDMTLYKHVILNTVLIAYGIQKEKWNTHPDWRRVDTVLTVGLDKDDDLTDITLHEKSETKRRIPITLEDIKRSIPQIFQNGADVVTFFTHGNESVAPPCCWNKDAAWPTSTAARHHNQHYTNLCAEFIYASLMTEDMEFDRTKKGRMKKGRKLAETARSGVSAFALQLVGV